MISRVLLLILLVVLPVPLHAAAPVKARALSGSGLLLLRSDIRTAPLPLVLYREPGMGRIAELEAGQLPLIVPFFQLPDGYRAGIVTAKKNGWYRIVYDSGEREGWVQGGAAYQYQRWEVLLPERGIAFPAGLRKDYYLLRSAPDTAAEQLEMVSTEGGLTVVKVAGDWINVRRGATLLGWLRWRDENGRLLISVDCRTL